MVTLHARSVDPDGDPVTFDFVPDPSVSRAVTLTKIRCLGRGAQPGRRRVPVPRHRPGQARRHQPGHHGAHPGRCPPTPSWWAGPTPTATVTRSAPTATTTNKAIFPGAREICGDDIDQNCDGRDLAAGECDVDGDRFTVEQGDCDDNDPGRNPPHVRALRRRRQQLQRPDRRDLQGRRGLLRRHAAPAGRPARPAAATPWWRWSATPQPGRPCPEICDMVDNDCNGRVDDVARQTDRHASDSCGGLRRLLPAAGQHRGRLRDRRLRRPLRARLRRPGSRSGQRLRVPGQQQRRRDLRRPGQQLQRP